LKLTALLLAPSLRNILTAVLSAKVSWLSGEFSNFQTWFCDAA
jgi:hypothetical protein